MTGLIVGLLIIGIVLFIGSFFVSEKLSDSDIEQISKLSEKEIKIILDKELEKSTSVINDKIEERLNESFDVLERKTDKETNEKIMQISEYSDTVLNSMNKSHDEIVFMYSMLNEKQEKVSSLTADIQIAESALSALERRVEDKIDELDDKMRDTLKEEAHNDFVEGINSVVVEADTDETGKEEQSIPNALNEHLSNEKISDVNVNDKIIELSKKGYSEIEIAKELGRGLGEVKLVLGLFRGKNEV